MTKTKLYHYTSHKAGPQILSSGVLVTRESNIRPSAGIGFPPPHASPSDPQVVWTFGDDGEPDGTVRWPEDLQADWENTENDAGLVRITLSVASDAVESWADFAARWHVADDWREFLESRGEPDRWCVVGRDVGPEEWVSFEARAASDSPWHEVGGWALGAWQPRDDCRPLKKLDPKVRAAYERRVAASRARRGF